MIADDKDCLLKIQVKYTASTDKYDKYKIDLRKKSSDGRSDTINLNGFDIVFIRTAAGHCYEIPVKDIPKSGRVALSDKYTRFIV